MDAFMVYVNDTCGVSAELAAESAISFSLDWIGNEQGEINPVLWRREHGGIHMWNLKGVCVGETVSFLVTTTSDVDQPTQLLTNGDLIDQRKKKRIMVPQKKPTRRSPIGTLGVLVNNMEIGETRLYSDNVFLIHFIWVGDSKGHSILSMGLGERPFVAKIPEIKFGDRVTLITKPKGRFAKRSRI